MTTIPPTLVSDVRQAEVTNCYIKYKYVFLWVSANFYLNWNAVEWTCHIQPNTTKK